MLDIEKLRAETIKEANDDLRESTIESFNGRIRGIIRQISENNEQIEKIREIAEAKVAEVEYANSVLRKQLSALTLKEHQDIAA